MTIIDTYNDFTFMMILLFIYIFLFSFMALIINNIKQRQGYQLETQ